MLNSSKTATALVAGALSAIAFLPSLVQAQGLSRSPVSTGYLYNFATNVDGGGEVSSQFFEFRGGLPLYRADERFIGISGTYRLNAYDFSGGGAGSFTSLNPWDNIHTIQLGLPIRWKLSDRWDFFGIPSIRSVGESGANFGDSISGGAILGASYRFGDRLVLGPGIGYQTQLEDDASIFPIILVEWEFIDNWTLTTGPTMGATLGPGLAVNWAISDDTMFSFGARYEKLRFRLDENSRSAPSGVGEDRAIPVFGGLSFKVGENLNMSVVGGVSFGGRLDLDDASGNRISRRDFDPAAFIGVNAGISF